MATGKVGFIGGPLGLPARVDEGLSSGLKKREHMKTQEEAYSARFNVLLCPVRNVICTELSDQVGDQSWGITGLLPRILNQMLTFYKQRRKSVVTQTVGTLVLE